MRTPREQGMRYGTEKKYVPTFDNNATITQLELLGRAFKLTQNPDYQQAFTRGLELVLIAQAPNGGWPQNYPLMGGYHDYLTFNDALMANILKLLHAVTQQKFGENLLDSTTMGRVEQSFIKALECVLQTQVVQAGRKTIWAGQYDPFTLKPAQARAYEMASLASAESVGIVEVLMSLDTPSEALQEATHAAIDWFKASAIKNTEWERGTANLIPKEGAPDLWARFYDLSTNQPIFGDRDGQVHTDIKKVSQERLKGYAWYTTSPNKLIKHYEKWAKKFPRKRT
jgi:PelA/Pel-15E family pectate lyase